MIIIMIMNVRTKRVKKLYKKKQRVKKYRKNRPTQYFSDSDLTPE